MKIATLLAQYLYTNHRLDLPGIGTFFLDPSAAGTMESSKQRSVTLVGVSFKSNPSLEESPDLVSFISAQTGKMKALANADLGSHLQLAQQFLNISKPFIFEGIGTLVMRKPGEYDFEPAVVSTERLKENKPKDDNAAAPEEAQHKYESFLAAPKTKADWRKPVIALLTLAGLSLAIWGGYTLSKRASGGQGNKEPEKENTQQPGVTPIDSLVSTPPPPPADTLPKMYKYVLEVANEKRAQRRYSQLKTNLWDVHLETKDSVQYKLFILLPAKNADTTRVVDSLTNWLGRKVYLEHQN